MKRKISTAERHRIKEKDEHSSTKMKELAEEEKRKILRKRGKKGKRDGKGSLCV